MEYLLGLLEGRSDWSDLKDAMCLLKFSILMVDAGASQMLLEFHMKRVREMVEPDREEVKEALELLFIAIDFRHASPY